MIANVLARPKLEVDPIEDCRPVRPIALADGLEPQ